VHFKTDASLASSGNCRHWATGLEPCNACGRCLDRVAIYIYIAICFVYPLSSEDDAVVVDFHLFTDCHLEAIFNMNTSRVQLRSSITVDGKDVRMTTGVFHWTRLSATFFRTVNHNCLFYQTSYNDFFEVYISNTVTLSPQCSKRCFHQFNFLNVNHMTNHSSFSLVNRLQLIYSVKVGYKYVHVHRHQLLILSKINNGESMTVTVLQRKASTQQIGLLVVPAIKGAYVTLIHILTSQPELTKLYNENIGGHHYIFTTGRQ